MRAAAPNATAAPIATAAAIAPIAIAPIAANPVPPPAVAPTMAWQWSLDPRAAIEVYRKALAPTLQAQQEGLGVFERLSRYQYAVIGDYLELGLAQAKAGLTARTPAELTVTQAALTSQFTARQQSRLRELVSLATDTQQSMQQLIVDATSRVAEGVKQVI